MDIHHGGHCKRSLSQYIFGPSTNQLQITCLVGIAGYFSLVDFPEKAATKSLSFLNPQECEFIIRRVNRDRGDALPEDFSFRRFFTPALDLKIWGFALIFLYEHPSPL